MEILFYSGYLNNKKTGEKECVLQTKENDLEEYLKFYIDILDSNPDKLSLYKLINDDNTRHVVSLIIKSIDNILNNADEKMIKKNMELINDRFFEKEVEAQSRVDRIKTEIKDGCLIQSIYENNDKFYYLIVKTEWDKFLAKQMKINDGIGINKKNLGKCALFAFNKKTMNLINISIYLDYPAKYFTEKFLELESEYTDEVQTKNMVDYTLKIIDKNLKAKYPQQRLEIRNTFIHKIKTTEFIDFEEIKHDVFQSYIDHQTFSSENEKNDFQKFMNQIDIAPQKGKFNNQFTIIKSAIKAKKLKNSYKLNPYATLEITDNLNENNQMALDSIVSGQEDNGDTFIKIYTTEDEVLKAFKQ